MVLYLFLCPSKSDFFCPALSASHFFPNLSAQHPFKLPIKTYEIPFTYSYRIPLAVWWGEMSEPAAMRFNSVSSNTHCPRLKDPRQVLLKDADVLELGHTKKYLPSLPFICQSSRCTTTFGRCINIIPWGKSNFSKWAAPKVFRSHLMLLNVT